ncbi:MAG: C40 family peptidase, partial [Treponema sp.]|nr:C40 family peptidase [Treponema sp.]
MERRAWGRRFGLWPTVALAVILSLSAGPLAAYEINLAVDDDLPEDPAWLEKFSDPSRVWGKGIEGALERAYREYFRTMLIGGRLLTVRMPFAQNAERDLLLPYELKVLFDGKGSPELLWPAIDRLLESADFAAYLSALSGGREQVLIFDLDRNTWESSGDFALIAGMKAGPYPGLPHRPHVLHDGRGPGEEDLYNYLYCIGLAGVDCSGFVWNVLVRAAAAGGVDLPRLLAAPAARGRRQVPLPAFLAGTAFFNSGNRHLVSVNDRIADLRPADVILFRGPDGQMAHSAVIQSVDFGAGIVRYLQSTDLAPAAERGVHESYVLFDPARPDLSLADENLRWTQRRESPFSGETVSPFADDG